jgi:hypothetical protein
LDDVHLARWRLGLKWGWGIGGEWLLRVQANQNDIVQFRPTFGSGLPIQQMTYVWMYSENKSNLIPKDPLIHLLK